MGNRHHSALARRIPPVARSQAVSCTSGVSKTTTSTVSLVGCSGIVFKSRQFHVNGFSSYSPDCCILYGEPLPDSLDVNADYGLTSRVRFWILGKLD
jgi:hypothetical protein